jgi:hypothetical protein
MGKEEMWEWEKVKTVRQGDKAIGSGTMGVQIFTMIGYKNDKGQMLRSKFVVFHIIPVLLFTKFLTRLETPQSHATSPQFLPIFNRTGGDVWQSWDTFLDESDGMSFTSTLA